MENTELLQMVTGLLDKRIIDLEKQFNNRFDNIHKELNYIKNYLDSSVQEQQPSNIRNKLNFIEKEVKVLIHNTDFLAKKYGIFDVELQVIKNKLKEDNTKITSKNTGTPDILAASKELNSNITDFRNDFKTTKPMGTTTVPEMKNKEEVVNQTEDILERYYQDEDKVVKKQVSIYLDTEVIEAFNEFGKEYGKGAKSDLVNNFLRDALELD